MLVFTLIISCNNQENNIIGKWKNINNPTFQIEFTKNGIYSLNGFDSKNKSFKFNFNYKYLAEKPQTVLSISSDSFPNTSNNIYINFINKNEIKIALKNKSVSTYTRIIE